MKLRFYRLPIRVGLLLLCSLLLCACGSDRTRLSMAPMPTVSVTELTPPPRALDIAESALPTPGPVPESIPELPEAEPGAARFVLNTSSKKFHRPDCEWLKEMKESNKRPVAASREEITAAGYEPCGSCRP